MDGKWKMQSRVLNALSRQLIVPRPVIFRRHNSLLSASNTPNFSDLPQTRDAWLFIDSLFPIRRGTWDLRFYFGLLRQEAVLDQVKRLLESTQSHNFSPLCYKPHLKDGGVFVHFRYSGEPNILPRIEADLREHVDSAGGLPSSTGLRGRAGIWIVKGFPWVEDMYRFASPLLRVKLQGPIVQEEAIYRTFRPYGRILNITTPVPIPNTPYRTSTLTFANVRAAAIAHNVAHGSTIKEEDPIHHNGATEEPTLIRTEFQSQVQAHAIKDWLTGHPRIVVPVIVFLLGALTYTVFDPIREFMVKAKTMDWLDYRDFRLYRWLQRSVNSSLSLLSGTTKDMRITDDERAWEQQHEAKEAIERYLSDTPNTVAFVHGPQGSGKTRMLHTILKDSGRPVLEIDIDVLIRAQSEAQIVDALARQTGYWPVFTALNSLSNLVDLASVGVIGQKAGLSSTLSDQLEHILTLVTSALRDVAATREKAIQYVLESERRERQQKEEEARTRARIAKGVWWDPRMGYVAGGGVMAELACGDEPFTVADEDVDAHLDLSRAAKETGVSEKGGAGRSAAVRDVKDGQDIRVLPIVVLRNFTSVKEEITGVFAEWVARLIEVQVAHVIVVSDNRNHSRQLAKVLPTKPLNVIALYDADAATALRIVQQRLRETDTDIKFTPEQEKLVGYLGGRASDLTFLIRKLRGGTSVEEAVEESITNGMSELRKNVFADDADDVKSLPWTKEQAWVVLHALAKRDEVPYHDMLVDFPFKGDEAALRSMEQTDFIAIGTVNGRPSVIKPGKPIYRHVFERLASDPVFQASQDLALNTKRIQIAQDIIAACEQELKTLNELSRGSEMRTSWLRPWADRPTTRRIRYLLQKMRTAETTVESLDKKNLQLKAVLKKGDSSLS